MIDYLIAGEPKKIERFKIETPVGTVESDSGNHMVDVISVVGVIGLLYLGKVLIQAYFKRKK